MPLESIQIVTVWVNDLNHALHFYTHILGLEKRSDQEFGEADRWVTVAPKGESTEITLRPAGEHGEAGRFTGIVFGSRDPRETFERLNRNGVEFTREPELQEWGAPRERGAEFRDPDGNGFVLHSVQEG
jgi:catechol 2,3-dioxygenase-like lactoylglutathione lyase family enzyme